MRRFALVAMAVFGGPSGRKVFGSSPQLQVSTQQGFPSSLAVLGQNPVNHFDSFIEKASATSFAVGYFLHF